MCGVQGTAGQVDLLVSMACAQPGLEVVLASFSWMVFHSRVFYVFYHFYLFEVLETTLDSRAQWGIRLDTCLR